MGLYCIVFIANVIYQAHHEKWFCHNISKHYFVGFVYSFDALDSLLYVNFCYCWVRSIILGSKLSSSGEGDTEYFECEVQNYENST